MKNIKTEETILQMIPGIEYKVMYSRRRTLSISVSPFHGVVVRAPYATSLKTIERFISQKTEWITSCLDSFKKLVRIDGRNGYSDGDQILLYGESHVLRLVPAKSFTVRIREGRIIEIGQPGNHDPLLIRTILEKRFKIIAEKELTLRFSDALVKYKNYGFYPSGFAVSTMKKRWGSCSSKGKIAISYDLIRLRGIYADYVIAHELCHLVHHNHSEYYYRLLTEVYPGWRNVRQELRKYLR
ncbi:MAG: M48 family metallopeptidase [Bacteroidales bacterium]|nr:M48 family metallopeptidase [Bacteroidales bacterium]